MAITRSYSNQTNTYYAYETSYEWSEEKQRKVQIKKLIGKYDENGQIIPTGSRGRPRKFEDGVVPTKNAGSEGKEVALDRRALADCKKDAQGMTKSIASLKTLLSTIQKQVDDMEHQIEVLQGNIDKAMTSQTVEAE